MINESLHFFALVFFWAEFSTAADGDSSPGVELDIFPATKIDTSKEDALVLSLLNSFNLLRNGSQRKLDTYGISAVNFYFASGPNFIVDRRVSLSALTAFSQITSRAIARLPTNTDSCYVQNFNLDINRQVTVVVHNEDFDDEEDIFRCLTAGLWWFLHGELDGFDWLDWRWSFRNLE